MTIIYAVVVSGETIGFYAAEEAANRKATELRGKVVPFKIEGEAI